MSGSRIFSARACSVSAAICFALAAAACSRAESSPARVSEIVPPRGGAITAPPRATAAADAAAGSEPHAADDAWAAAPPVTGRSVGHTSVVFKLTLEGGSIVAFKPRSAHGDHRYRGEIAAHRLAQALSLENVPPAMPRAFDYRELAAILGREATFNEVVREPDGRVRGALIPWIKGLEFLPLENAEWMPRWRSWLRAGGAIPPDQRALAAQISDVLAFDLVTGNWDRWSGGNIGIDRARQRLLYVDNDAAFFDPPPVKEMRWPTALFEGVDRYSRSFVAALRGLDVARAVGEEAPGEPLLSARILAETEARRKRVLEVIDAKIARYGEADVLAFD